ncbi:MAG: LytTR family DNA-binding domain-containing protein [Bacteroidia bacterium]
MIKTLIVDDEQPNRNFLIKVAGKLFPDIEIVGEAANVDEALSKVKETKPDLVLLDIEMPGKTGFDFLIEVGDVNFEVIFITGYDEYAIKAFKFNAIDYLLKPVDLDDFENAINKVRERLKIPKTETKNQQVSSLLQNIKSNQNPINKIGVPTNDGIVFLNIEDIILCEADGNYTVFHLAGNNKFISSRTLKEYDELLAGYNFFRAHKSHLINLKHIKRYIKGEGGTVIMSNDKEVEVSRRNKEGFMLLMKELM